MTTNMFRFLWSQRILSPFMTCQLTLTRVRRRVPHVEQDLLILLEHKSPSSEVRIAQRLVFYVFLSTIRLLVLFPFAIILYIHLRIPTFDYSFLAEVFQWTFPHFLLYFLRLAGMGEGVFYITTLTRHNVTCSLTLCLACKLFLVMNIDETLINLRKAIKINQNTYTS